MAPNSLYLVKYYNAASGKTEVHSVSGASSYKTFTVHAVTPDTPQDALNGTWAVEKGNVYFIKTQNTGTNTIEVHRLSKTSNYGVWDIHSRSGFSIDDAFNGTWTIDNDDLYFIKTQNTPGTVEVHKANHSKGFAVDFHSTTGFPTKDCIPFYTIRGGDLYVIKFCDTTSGHVEVDIATRSSGYKSITRHITWFQASDRNDGIWDINSAGDLYFIKRRRVGSGHIEVHYATAASGYQSVSHFATAFDPKDAGNGSWAIDPVA